MSLSRATDLEDIPKYIGGSDAKTLRADGALNKFVLLNAGVYKSQVFSPGAVALPVGDADVFVCTNVNADTTFNVPTGLDTVFPPKIIIAMKNDNTAIRNLSWNAIFRGSADLPLPAAMSALDVWDYLGFIYNQHSSTWDLISYLRGF